MTDALRNRFFRERHAEKAPNTTRCTVSGERGERGGEGVSVDVVVEIGLIMCTM